MKKRKAKSLLAGVLTFAIAFTQLAAALPANAAGNEQAENRETRAAVKESTQLQPVSTKWVPEEWDYVGAQPADKAEVVTTSQTWMDIKAVGGDNASNRPSVSSTQAGDIKNGTFTATVVPNVEMSSLRFGIQIRYQDQGHLVWVAHDNSGWYLQRKDDGVNKATGRVRPDLRVGIGEELKIQVTFHDQEITLVVNGETVFDKNTEIYSNGGEIRSGDVGFMLGRFNGNEEISVTDIHFTNEEDPGASEGYDWTADEWVDSNKGNASITKEVREGNGYYELMASDANFPMADSAVVVNNTVGKDGNFKNGVIDATFTPQSGEDSTSFAIVYRYTDINNCAWFGYDNTSGWYRQQRIENVPATGQDGNGYEVIEGKPVPKAGEPVNIRLVFEDGNLTAIVNNEVYFDGPAEIAGKQASTALLEPGKVGFLARSVSGAEENTHVTVQGFDPTVWDIDAPPEEVPAENLVDLTTDQMTVSIDKTFPRVFKYTFNSGKVLYGQPKVLDTLQIKVNGGAAIDVQPDVTFEQQGTTALYTMAVKNEAAGLDAVIKAQLKAEGNVISFDITEIVNNIPETKINTIYIPNFSLVSVNNAETDAMFDGTVMSVSAVSKGDRNVSVDKKFTPYSSDYKDEGYMYAFVSNSDFSAGVWSNSEANDNKRVMRYSQVSNLDGVAFSYIGLGSNEWTYHQNDMPAPQTTMPSMKAVIVEGDQNEDGKVTWQDGAIAYRDIMNNPYKSEEVPDLVAQRIVENFASQAAHPFLETLDGIKRVNLATDGLGQQILLKGYASEGHDSAHPDYGDIGTRIGGAEDMVYLLDKAEAYGAKIGVHINADEAYPEADAFNELLINKNSYGWNWVDESYSMDKTYDLASGARAERLDDLYYQLGGEDNKLDFIYLDVWGAQSWPTRRVAQQFNERGWRCANEWGGANEYDCTWNHWAVDVGYGNAGNTAINSDMARFLRNHQKDSWISNWTFGGASDHPLLGGAQLDGFEGWQREQNFTQYIQNLFNVNLPTKFLQHYLITYWENDPTLDETKTNTEKLIKLERENGDGSVDKVEVSRIDGTRGRTITFNGRTVLTTLANNVEAYLLPWFWDENGNETENKLYHYNAQGGSTTWQLPEGWENAKVYELTDTGKVEADIATVADGMITLDAAAKTPYVLYQAEPEQLNPTFEEMNWGDGTHLVNPNFTSATLEGWTVEGDGTGINRDASNNNPTMEIRDNTGVTTVSQTMTDLEGGKRYAALVAVENNADAKAYIEVTTPDGKTVSNYTEASILQNYVGVNAHHTSKMQNMYVFFTMPEGATSATITLKRDAGEGYARFDEVRVVETEQDNWMDDITFYQDFENNVQGIYPFAVGGYMQRAADIKIHLSEKHAPYTQREWNNRWIDDVLEGDWSLKAHQLTNYNRPIYQTIPQNFRFEPGKTYTISFQYESGWDDAYSFVVGDGAYNYGTGGTDQLVSATPLKATTFNGTLEGSESNGPQTFTATVTGSESGNTWIGIFSNTGTPAASSKPENPLFNDTKGPWKTGIGSIVLDTLVIREGEADVSGLVAAIEAAQALDENNYTTDSWKVLASALEDGKAVLADSSSNQTAIDDAAKAINDAIANLVEGDPDQPGDVNKSTLQYVLQLAQVHVDNGDVDNLIPAAKEQFEKTMAEAQAIYDDAASTQEQVDQAWKKLLLVIQAMDFIPGDKTELADLIVQAQNIDLTQYEDGAEKDAFEAALQEAVAVLADPNAMENDITAAYDKLEAAMQALIPLPEPGDKTELKKAIDIANGYDLSKYVDDENKENFLTVLEQAEAVYADEAATQDVIDEAWRNLLDATVALRLRADKDNLEQWLEELKAIDLSQYTEESAAAVRAAIANAEALASQDLGTDQESLIRLAIAQMQLAKENLVLKDNNPGDSNSSGKPADPSSGSDGNTGSDPAKTGDSAPIAAISVMAVAAAGALWMLRKRKD